MDELRFVKEPSIRVWLARYRDLLVAHAPEAGLTSLRDPAEIERRHIGESLALMEALEAKGLLVSPVIDIGAGGGLPGIPLKIARPELEMTLLEATRKKVAFLELAVRDLQLHNVNVVGARAEDAARDPAHRERYRLALARAVAPLPVLIELALPFLQVGGALASPKGSRASEEVAAAENALSECGGEVEGVYEIELPWPGTAPSLVIVRKTSQTPERYPRRAGIPAKRPL